jgi:hypothetical protein
MTHIGRIHPHKKHYYKMPLYQQSVTLCSNGQSARRCCPIATVVSQYRRAGFSHRYYGSRGTHEVAASAHSSDGQSDINRPLLLPPTIVTCSMTSEDRCYCGVRGTRAVADSAQSNDGPYDISGLLLLWDTWHVRGCY